MKRKTPAPRAASRSSGKPATAAKAARSAKPAALRAARLRVAVGPPRPQYLLNEENDRMMMIITALAAEVSALRERLDTHEALAEKRTACTTAAVEKFRLTDARQQAREQARQQMLARVFRIVLEDLDAARQLDQQSARQVLNEEVTAK